jgi:hypothetical protein
MRKEHLHGAFHAACMHCARGAVWAAGGSGRGVGDLFAKIENDSRQRGTSCPTANSF